MLAVTKGRKREASARTGATVQGKSRKRAAAGSEAANMTPAVAEHAQRKPFRSHVIIEVVSKAVGAEVVDLVIELITQDDYSEFKLSEKLAQDVNQTRNMLYRLLEHNFVTFNRRKDARKGWYVYYWTVLPYNIEKHLVKLKEQELYLLRERLNHQGDHDIFFACPQDCGKFDFDQTTELGFHCPDCGSLLEQHDATQAKDHLAEQIASLEAEIGVLQQASLS